MVPFIVGFLIVVLSENLALKIFGLLVMVVGMFLLIEDERVKGEIICHEQVCPGCDQYKH